MLSNLSRKEIRAKMQQLYKASKEPLPSFAKINFNIKQFREKLKNGYTFEQFAADYPKIDLPDLTFEGETRYDDLIKISSGTKYPKVLLDIIATNKESALAFSALDHELATFEEKIEQKFDETYLKEFPYKNFDDSKLDWDYLYKVTPEYRRSELQYYKEQIEKMDKEPNKITLDHIMDLYDDEIQAMLDLYDKEVKYLNKREKFYAEEMERTYDFYERLPSFDPQRAF